MTVVAYVVMKGKTEVERHQFHVDDSVQPAPNDDAAEVTFTLTPALKDAVSNGALDIGVGFMRGDVKMSGDFGVLLRVLPVLSRAGALEFA